MKPGTLREKIETGLHVDTHPVSGSAVAPIAVRARLSKLDLKTLRRKKCYREDFDEKMSSGCGRRRVRSLYPFTRTL